MIAVLEHLNDPHEIMNLFLKSKLKYLYISIPLFSLSALIENSFKNIFPRHLGGAHTHLFTSNSINYFKKKYNLRSVGEWWFGTDFLIFLGLYKFHLTHMTKKHIQNFYINIFFSSLNELQNVLDRKKICSEVHLILKKNESKKTYNYS